MHREPMVLCRSLMTDVTENVLGLLKVLKRKSRSLWKWLCSFASIAASFIVCLKRVTVLTVHFQLPFPSGGNIKNVLRLSGIIRRNAGKKSVLGLFEKETTLYFIKYVTYKYRNRYEWKCEGPISYLILTYVVIKYFIFNFYFTETNTDRC